MVEIKDEKLDELRDFMNSFKEKEHSGSYLIAILHKAQELYGYLSEEIMDEVAITMKVPSSHIWGVATFYHYFNLKPVGKHKIAVCLGTACYIKGADRILNVIKEHLKIDVGETTEDNLFTLQETRCLGACGLAPVIMIDDKMYGKLTPKEAIKILKSYKE